MGENPECFKETVEKSGVSKANQNCEKYPVDQLQSQIFPQHHIFISTIVNLQKNRAPSNIVIVTDERDNFDLNLPNYDARISVLKIPGIKFENAFTAIKNYPQFGKGTMFVFSCGIHDLHTQVPFTECLKHGCPMPQYILVNLHDICTPQYLVSKALELNLAILNSTTDDVALFCGLLPIAQHRYNIHVVHHRPCVPFHPAMYPEDNALLNYNAIINYYNSFSKYHAQVLGYTPWDLDVSYYVKPIQDLLLPNCYNIHPEEEANRINQVKFLCDNLIVTLSSRFKVTTLSQENYQPVHRFDGIQSAGMQDEHLRATSSSVLKEISPSTTSKESAFNEVFFIGRRESVNMLADCNVKSTLIYYSFNSELDLDVNRMLDKIGKISDKSICCLVFDLSIITQTVKSSHCHKYSCEEFLSVSTLRHSIDSYNKMEHLIFNELQSIEKFAKMLSVHIPVLILPLAPMRIFCDDSDYQMHRIGHTVVSMGFRVVDGSRSLWQSTLKCITSSWIDLVKNANKKYDMHNYIANFVENNKEVFSILDFASEFLTDWKEQLHWKSFLYNSLSCIVRIKSSYVESVHQRSSDSSQKHSSGSIFQNRSRSTSINRTHSKLWLDGDRSKSPVSHHSRRLEESLLYNNRMRSPLAHRDYSRSRSPQRFRPLKSNSRSRSRSLNYRRDQLSRRKSRSRSHGRLRSLSRGRSQELNHRRSRSVSRQRSRTVSHSRSCHRLRSLRQSRSKSLHHSRSRSLHRSRSRPLHRSRSRLLHRSRSRPLHRSRSRSLHRSISQSLHRSRSRSLCRNKSRSLRCSRSSSLHRSRSRSLCRSRSSNYDIVANSNNHQLIQMSSSHNATSWSTSRKRSPRLTHDGIPRPTCRDEIPRPTSRDRIPRPTSCDRIPRPTSCDRIPRSTSRDDRIPRPTSRNRIPRPTSRNRIPRPTSRDRIPRPTCSEKMARPTSRDEMPRSIRHNVMMPRPNSCDGMPRPYSGDGMPKPNSGDGMSRPNSRDGLPRPNSRDGLPRSTSRDRIPRHTSRDRIPRPTCHNKMQRPSITDKITKPKNHDKIPRPTNTDRIQSSSNPDKRVRPNGQDLKSLGHNKKLRSKNQERSVSKSYADPIKESSKLHSQHSSKSGSKNSHSRHRSVTPPKKSKEVAIKYLRRSELDSQSSETQGSSRSKTDRKISKPSSRMKVSAKPSTSAAGKRPHSKSASPVSKRSRVDRRPFSSELPESKQISVCYTEDQLRNKFGAELFEVYAAELKEMRSKFEEEFEAFKTAPEFHPNFEFYYEKFVTKYSSQYKGKNEQYKDTLWRVFWKSQFDTFKEEEFLSRQQKLIKDFEATEALLRRGQITSPKNKSDAPFSFEAALSLIEKLSDDIAYLGPSIKLIINEARSLGTTSKDAYDVFTNEDNLEVLDFVLNKFKSLNNSSKGELRCMYEKAIEWIPLMIAEAEKGCTRNQLNSDNIPIDIKAISKISLGKSTEFAIELIQTALAYEGIDKPSTQLINELYLKVCTLHLSLKNG